MRKAEKASPRPLSEYQPLPEIILRDEEIVADSMLRSVIATLLKGRGKWVGWLCGSSHSTILRSDFFASMWSVRNCSRV
jgi:hypothetical protein